MSWKFYCLAVVFIVSYAFGLAGCESMKAKPSSGAGFVQAEKMSKRDDIPFHNVWVKSGVDWGKYKSISISPVNTRFLLEANWWQQSVKKSDMERDAADVAQYMQSKFIEAFNCDPKNRFRVVNVPGPDSLILELALTELIPSHPVMEALSIVAPYGSGVAVQAVAKESGAKCTVAFEAKIIDATNGQVLAMAADREQGKVAPINLKALSWYGEAYTIIDEWSGQFVKISNKRPGEVVKDTSPFTLSPW
jgi:hypothetical protein